MTKRQVVAAAAKKHHVPFWLLWGIFGAESTWGTNGNNYFGLIEPQYHMVNGTVRTPKDTTNIAESADIAAELLASLKQERGSWAAAVNQYAPYSIQHPLELSRQGGSHANEKVQKKDEESTGLLGLPSKAPFHLPLPGPLDPGNIWEEVVGAGGAVENALDPISEVANSVKFVGETLKRFATLFLTPEGWIKIGKALLGVVFLLWGIRVASRATTGYDPGNTVSKAAKTAATVAVVK